MLNLLSLLEPSTFTAVNVFLLKLLLFTNLSFLCLLYLLYWISIPHFSFGFLTSSFSLPHFHFLYSSLPLSLFLTFSFSMVTSPPRSLFLNSTFSISQFHFLSSSLPLYLFLTSPFSLPHFLFLYCDFPAPFAIPRSTFSISQFYFLYFSILFALLYSTVPIYSLHSPLCIYLYMLYPIVIRIAQYVGNCCAIW